MYTYIFIHMYFLIGTPAEAERRGFDLELFMMNGMNVYMCIYGLYVYLCMYEYIFMNKYTDMHIH
jgi:hypothetical protein